MWSFNNGFNKGFINSGVICDSLSVSGEMPDFRDKLIILAIISVSNEKKVLHSERYYFDMTSDLRFNFTTLKYFCINHRDQKFFQFEIIINVFVSSFEYLCYGSAAFINTQFFQYGDRLKTSDYDVLSRSSH